MTRSVLVTGAVLFLLGSAVFAWKVGVHDLPLRPSDPRGMWQIELRVTVRGEGKQGSVYALLPAAEAGQIVFDERSASDRLDFSIRTRDSGRVGVWQGWLENVHEIVYQFRVQSFPVRVELPEGPFDEPPPAVALAHGRPSPEFPATAPAVAELVERLDLPAAENRVARVRTLYAFVSHEIDTIPTAGDDAMLTLTQREGSETGKARLLVTLLRATGTPARLVRGLELREAGAPQERVWCEAWVGDRWLPLSSDAGFLAEIPPSWIALGRGPRGLIETSGVRATGYRFRALRERLRPEEIALLMAPTNPVLERISLYRLPIGVQTSLRALLLLPLGVLLVSVFRNLVGVPTYGTFMPLLIAFALRGFPLLRGLALVGLVLVLGVAARLAVERLRLLMVPRLSILLCVVVASVAVLALLGDAAGQGELFAGVLFPIVILTMLVERFTIATAEEGWRAASIPAAGSLAVAVVTYPVLRSTLAEHVMFSFPELVLAVIGLLVWIGGYTGYRVADLVRFRMFARSEPFGMRP